MGRPKTTRSLAYWVARRSAARPMPMASAPIRMRSGLRLSRMIAEAHALLADAVGFRHLQIVDEDLVRIDGGAAHLLDLPRLDAGAVELGIEEAHAVGRLGAIGERRGARQQEDAGGDLGERGPDLPAGDHIASPPAPGHRRDPGGVEAGIGLGHAEGADVAALDQGRQEAPALRLAAMLHDDPRREDGDMHCRGAGHAGTGFRHRLHGQRRLGDAEPGPAIFLRHGGADPAAGGEGGHELAGKFPVAVARQPIAVVEPLAKSQHVLADHLLLVAQHGPPCSTADK